MYFLIKSTDRSNSSVTILGETLTLQMYVHFESQALNFPLWFVKFDSCSSLYVWQHSVHWKDSNCAYYVEINYCKNSNRIMNGSLFPEIVWLPALLYYWDERQTKTATKEIHRGFPWVLCINCQWELKCHRAGPRPLS